MTGPAVPGDGQRDRVGRPLPPRQPRPVDTGDRGCLACTHMDGGVYCSNDSSCPRPAAPVVRAEGTAGELTQAVADEIARHGDVISGQSGLAFWLECSCGWFGGQLLKKTGGVAGARDRWRLHRADAVLALPGLRELAAAEKVRRMEAEHRPELIEDVGPEGPVTIAICVADHDYWPCDVRRALDGEDGDR